MNKKFKKILAIISAVTMCAVSVVSTYASAYVNFDNKITPYTTEFTCEYGKYHLCQEWIDYYADTKYSDFCNIYVADEPIFYKNGKSSPALGVRKYVVQEEGKEIVYTENCAAVLGFGEYKVSNAEEALLIENILSQYNVEYTYSDYHTDAIVPEEKYTEEYIEAIQKIKDETGLILGIAMELSSITVTDVVNTLPEPTLSGDTDCNDKVNINDAVLVMQSIANPDKYQISWQGKANADIDGNGITLGDAIVIQEMAASHLYD